MKIEFTMLKPIYQCPNDSVNKFNNIVIREEDSPNLMELRKEKLNKIS